VPLLLGVGLDEQTQRDAADFDAALVQTPDEALELLNVLNADLLIGGTALSDEAMSDLADRLSRQFPRQRWAIVARELELQREQFLRALGGLGVFDDVYTCLHFAWRRGRDSPAFIPSASMQIRDS
jgi:hypothetical protein